MYIWGLPTYVPVLLGYFRVSENVTVTFDFMVFEIVMCAVLLLLARGILHIKVAKLQQANERANQLYNYLSKEPYSGPQNKCLRRCLSISDAALNEYDSLLMYFGRIQNQPSRRVCLQRWPGNIHLLKKLSTEESFSYLKRSLSNTIREDNQTVTAVAVR